MSYKDSLDAANANKSARELMPTFFQFKEEGDAVVGRLLSRSTITSKKNKGTYTDYVFDTDDGVVHFACGSVFDTKCGAQMHEGSIYAIEFLGKQAIGGGQQVNQFKALEVPETGKQGSFGSQEDNPL